MTTITASAGSSRATVSAANTAVPVEPPTRIPSCRVTARAVTPLVDGLEGEGLMLRKADRADRRAFRLHLTETGEGLRSVISDLQEKVSDQVFSALNQTDRDQLAELLRKLLTA